MKPVTNPLALRILRALAKTLLALMLLLTTLWLGAYFALGSGPGQRALAGLVREEAGVEPAIIKWGPAPDRLVVGGLAVSSPAEDGRAGLPLAALKLATVDLGLWSLLGPNPTLQHLRIDLAHVRANIGPDGRVDLLMVLAPPRRPGATPGKPREKALPRFSIERLELTVEELLVMQGVEGLHFRDLTLGGRVVLGERLEARLELNSGELHLAMDRGRRVWAGAGLGLTLSVVGPPATPSNLELEFAASMRHSDERVSRVVFRAGPERPAMALIDADLSGADAEALFPGSELPHGIQLAGLSLEAGRSEGGDVATRKLSGALGHAFAPVLGLGSAELHDASFGLSALSVDVERLIPQVEVTFSHLQAGRLVLRAPARTEAEGTDTAEPAEPAENAEGAGTAGPGSGWTLEGLDFAGGQLSFLRRLELHLWPGRAHWGLGHAPAELVELAIDADLGLTGGPITAHINGALGAVLARGKLRVSPLTGKTGFGAELAFAELEGGFARALLPGFPAEHPLSGSRELRVSGTMNLELESGADGPAVAFDEGLVWWSGGRSRWDGYGWADEPLAPGDPGDPGDPSAPRPEDSP